MKLFGKKNNRKDDKKVVTIEDMTKMLMEYNEELKQRNQEILDKLNK